MLTRAKSKIEKHLQGLAQVLKVHPNVLTIISISLSLPAPLLAYILPSKLAALTCLVIFSIASLMDMLDGIVARYWKLESKLGAFLDSVCDRYVDFLALLSLLLLVRSFCVIILVFLTIVGSFMTSYSRARAESLGVSLAGVGLFERGERILAILTLFLVLCLTPLSLWNMLTIVWLSVLALLTNLTALHRILYVVRRLRRSPS